MHLLPVIGALLGTQNGRDTEIVNSFDLVTNAEPGSDLGLGEGVGIQVEIGFLNERKEQCKWPPSLNHHCPFTRQRASPFTDKQVFPNLDLIGWYTVSTGPNQAHIAIHEQVRLPSPVTLWQGNSSLTRQS